MLASKILDLGSLLVDQVVALLKLSINNLLVLDVNEWANVGNGRGNQGQAPERDELDEEVGDQGCKECLCERYNQYGFFADPGSVFDLQHQ